MAQGHKRPWLVVTMAMLGGALTIAALFLPWLDTGGVNIGTQVVSGTPTGLETSTGIVVLASGIVAVLGAIVLVTTTRASRMVAVILIVAGVAGLVGASMILTSPRDAYIDFAAAELGVGSSEIEHSLTSLFEIGGIRDDPGVGIFASLAGGGLTFLSGAIGVLILGRRRVQPPASADEVDPEDGQDVEAGVWERSFDDAKRSVDRTEDQPAAPTGADPEEEHTAREAEEPTAPQRRKDLLGDSWVG